MLTVSQAGAGFIAGVCLNKLFVSLSKVTCSVKITGVFSNDGEEESGKCWEIKFLFLKKTTKNTWININQTGKISRPHTS